MRVTTAFSRLLRLGKGVVVKKVRFEPDRVVVEVALRRRRLVCPECGYSTRARKDTRPENSVWRHLDLGVWRLEIHCRRRRLWCPEHGARTEGVPFARPRSEFTRDFECLVAWLATRTDKTTITQMLRIDWGTVGRIIKRVCDDELDPDRLNDLFDIGIDEVSWKRQHNYLTLVADHRRGKIVWGCEGKGEKAADAFFAELDPEPAAPAPAARAAQKLKRPRSWSRSARARPSPPATASPPRGSTRLRARAGDRRARLQADRHLDGHDRRLRRLRPPPRAAGGHLHRPVPRGAARQPGAGRGPPSLLERAALPRRPGRRQALQGRPLVHCSRRPRSSPTSRPPRSPGLKAAGGEVWRAYTLKEAVRGIFEPGLSLEDVTILIDRLLSRLARSRLEPFVRLGKTIRKHRDGILAAIRLGINQGRTEALNNKVRLITRRAYGFHSAKAALALIMLTCGPITLHLPHELHALGIA